MIRTSDIVNKAFTKSFMGYDVREVDAFLDAIIEELERRETERKELTGALEYLLHELEQYDKSVKSGGGGQNVLEQADRLRKRNGPIRVTAPAAESAREPAREPARKRVAAPVALEVETGEAAPLEADAASDAPKAAPAPRGKRRDDAEAGNP